MPEEERLRLVAILERIALVHSWVAGKSEGEFVADLLVRDAVALSVMLIGETSRRLLDDTRARTPEIPWPAIRSLRNRIAHGYETVDHKLVWQIINDDLPVLESALKRLLAAG
jgi:uncharacterized protein with HEPN domain